MKPVAGPRFLGYGRWHAHVNCIDVPLKMRPWLVDAASLTAKLRARCTQFRVQRLRQRQAVCLKDEAGVIALPRPSRVWEREVLLQCNGQAMVFAHTIVPFSATAWDWPLFSALGERSLGTTLFDDPQVRRGALQFARLRSQHPLMLRCRAAVNSNSNSLGSLGSLGSPDRHEFETELYARRCLYRRKQGVMLVTEVFLPAVAELPLHSFQLIK